MFGNKKLNTTFKIFWFYCENSNDNNFKLDNLSSLLHVCNSMNLSFSMNLLIYSIGSIKAMFSALQSFHEVFHQFLAIP